LSAGYLASATGFHWFATGCLPVGGIVPRVPFPRLFPCSRCLPAFAVATALTVVAVASQLHPQRGASGSEPRDPTCAV